MLCGSSDAVRRQIEAFVDHRVFNDEALRVVLESMKGSQLEAMEPELRRLFAQRTSPELEAEQHRLTRAIYEELLRSDAASAGFAGNVAGASVVLALLGGLYFLGPTDLPPGLVFPGFGVLALLAGGLPAVGADLAARAFTGRGVR
jgi:hypothetical protein